MTVQYTAQELKTGLSLAVIANVIWGVSALYWVETFPVRPQDVVAHRAIWSLPVAAAVLIWAGDLATHQSAKPVGLECVGYHALKS